MNRPHMIERPTPTWLDANDALGSAVKQVAALSPSFNWVGIYVLDGDTLELGPYIGAPTEHTRIKVGVGVCGTAVARNEDLNVPDVTAADNYLACSVETQSELVVLIHDQAGASPRPDRHRQPHAKRLQSPVASGGQANRTGPWGLLAEAGSQEGTSMMTRRQLITAGLAGTAAAITATWRTSTCRRGTGLRSHAHGCRVEEAADTQPICGAAARGDRAPVLQSAAPRGAARHLRVCGLRPRPVLLHDEVRQPHGMAELLGAARQGGDHRARPLGRHGPNRRQLPALRRPPGPRVRRWSEADRTALLHERRGDDVQARHHLTPPARP